MQPFALEVAAVGGTTVVRVTGDLDISTSPELLAAVEGAGDGPLVVDLTTATFMDSTGLSALIRGSRQVGSGFVVVCPAANTRVLRVVTFAGSDLAIPLVETLDEAFARL